MESLRPSLTQGITGCAERDKVGDKSVRFCDDTIIHVL